MSQFRKHGRFIASNTVKISHVEGREITAKTRDMSVSGVFLDCNELPRLVVVGETLEAHIFDTDKSPKKAMLKVVRLCDDGVGAEYH